MEGPRESASSSKKAPSPDHSPATADSPHLLSTENGNGRASDSSVPRTHGTPAPAPRPEDFLPESARELPSEHTPKSRWITIAILTAIWHLALLWFASDIRPPRPQERTEIQQIDPAKLDAIRKQMKGLLLSQDKSPKTDTPPPEDARYESNRNRRVEREQRARVADTVPRPGQPGAGSAARQARPAPPSRTDARNIPLSKLGALSNLHKRQPPRSPDSQNQNAGAPGGGGAQQALIDRDLPEGAENLLNTQESVYYTYYARIFESVAPIWQSLVRRTQNQTIPYGDYITRVEVIWDGDGNYVETRYIQRSGHEEFDRIVEEAWKKTPRFPNPPKGLIGPDGLVHMGWTFVVYVNEGQGWGVAPPTRDY